MNKTLTKTPNRTLKKFKWTRKSWADIRKEWWKNLSDIEKQEYRDKKDLDQTKLEEEFKETSKKVEKLYSKISSFSYEQLSELFHSLVRFRDYSTMNNLFIHASNPNATTVAWKQKWFTYWYKLKKEAKAIHICAPISKVVFSKDISIKQYKAFEKSSNALKIFKIKNKIHLNFSLNDIVKVDDDTYKLMIRKTVWTFSDKAKVYDISDVEPIIKNWKDYSKSLNDFTLKSNIDYKTLKEKIIKNFWFCIEEKPMKVSTWWFVVVWDKKSISINSYLDETNNAWALIHELSHLLLWHTDENHKKSENWSSEYEIQYTLDEIQAETLAFLFRDKLWIKSKSEMYITWYLKWNNFWDEILKKLMKKSIRVFEKNKKLLI